MKNSQNDIARSVPRTALKQWIKSAIFFCLYYSGLEYVMARLLPAEAVAVLMYHGVCDGAMMPAHINFHVARDTFGRQMRVLKRRYPIVPLSDVASALARGERLQKGVALTFDDGYKNNACYVAPVLRHLGLPFTIFVATSYVEAQRWLPLNEVYWLWSVGELSAEDMNALRMQIRSRPLAETGGKVDAVWGRNHTAVTTQAEESFAMLNWDEIRSMADDGVEFGSHTHSHCNMATESAPQQCAELLASKQLLESRLERPIRLFAYPYGHAQHMSEDSRRNVIEAGYECAVSAEYGLVTSRGDRFCLPRLGYDQRIWVFAGEILYQFAKQAAKDFLSGRTSRTKEPRG
jgi:peptidoglycan/xylan/chitin deacetylase (PgdA/CDA1 family)